MGLLNLEPSKTALLGLLNTCTSATIPKKKLFSWNLTSKRLLTKIEHYNILKLLEVRGFGSTWLVWIKNILSSGTSKVLLTGIPGKAIHCKRGVRQGDPLSPLLFVLASDLLQSLLNKVISLNLLKMPVPLSSSPDFPVIQYAETL